MAVFEHRLPPNLMVDEIFSEIAIVCGSTKEHIIFPLSMNQELAWLYPLVIYITMEIHHV